MARGHLFRPVTDELGNLLYGAQVTVHEPGNLIPLGQAIYPGPSSGAIAMANPFTIDGGYIDIWLDTPQRVHFLIETLGRDPISIYLDVNPPANEVLRTAYPFSITNQPGSALILIGDGPDTASWQAAPTVTPGVAPPHDHDGAGVNSTALGTGAAAAGLRATAVGDSSVASAADSTAFGFGAQATAAGATAFGSNANASGADASAIGNGSQAGAGATAVGANTVASAVRSAAIGVSAQAIGSGSTAVGWSAVASGTDSLAVGASAQATFGQSSAIGTGAVSSNVHSLALGAGAATNADNQIALGTSADTVLVLGNLQALANAVVGGAASTVGFFGSAGVAKQTVTGSDGGDLVLRALLVYLDQIGLITNSSTP